MSESEQSQQCKKQASSVAEELFKLSDENNTQSKNIAQSGDVIIMTSNHKTEFNIMQNFNPHAYFILYGKTVLQQTDKFVALQQSSVDLHLDLQSIYHTIIETQDSQNGTISPEKESSLLICFSQKNSQKFMKSIEQYEIKARVVGKVKTGNNKTKISDKQLSVLI
eukprot:TRINITY_DN8492_c0_g1_i4.p1 TRINITY_DN8492_c0_g1~~TRINITY_DN8492_c0_g1_i4.p1  ORF type:complete len:166 (+),score=19.67 TRINITY_DN8492_c0_g1_i4:422-919(+)